LRVQLPVLRLVVCAVGVHLLLRRPRCCVLQHLLRTSVPLLLLLLFVFAAVVAASCLSW
jgi:hypothetical protein